MTEQERKSFLHLVLGSYRPINNTKANRIMLEMVTNDETTVKDYVLALADGLRYGNWPWNTNSKPKIQNIDNHAINCEIFIDNVCNCEYSSSNEHYHNCAIYSNDKCNCGVE